MIQVDTDFLQAFEQGLNPRYPEQSAIPAKVLGYGEISTVLEIDTPETADLAFKRMPMFHNIAEANAYEALYKNYCETLNDQIGISVVPGALFWTLNPTSKVVVMYIVQERLPVGLIGHKALHRLRDDDCVHLVKAVLQASRRVFAFNRANQGQLEVGFDIQISNWALQQKDLEILTLVEPVRLIYLDTSTPLMRRNAQEQLEPELFLRSAPIFLRGLLRRLYLQELLARYYDLRQVSVDLLANFYKEQRPDLLPRLLPEVNALLADDPDLTPITLQEVQQYYRSDASIWRVYLGARKFDRFLHRLTGRPYAYVLPEHIKR